jgi:hypothetical protein
MVVVVLGWVMRQRRKGGREGGRVCTEVGAHDMLLTVEKKKRRRKEIRSCEVGFTQ